MKKMMKKTFSLLLIFMLVFTMIPTSTLKVSAKAAAATTQAKKATKKTAKKKKKTKAKKQRTVFIAAGHQQRGISSTERLAPGSSRRKAKLTSGTAGVRTHIPEYKTNLAIAKIPTMILECGFLTNPTEDRQLNSSSYQKKLAKGIANGVDKYFK